MGLNFPLDSRSLNIELHPSVPLGGRVRIYISNASHRLLGWHVDLQLVLLLG